MASATVSAKSNELSFGTHGWICSILMMIVLLGVLVLNFPSKSSIGFPAFFAAMASFVVVTFYGYNTKKKSTTYVVLIAGIALTAVSGSYFARLADHSLTQCFVRNDGLVWDGYGNGRFALPIQNRCVIFMQYYNQRTVIGDQTYEIHCHIAKTNGSILYNRLGENYENIEAILKPVADSFDKSMTVSQMEEKASQALDKAGLSDLVHFQHITAWPTPNPIPES